MTLLKWQEPVAYVRASYRHSIKSNRDWRPRFAAICAAGFMGLWLFGHLNPKNTPAPWWAAVLISVVIGLIFAYLIPLVFLLAGAQVTIKEKKIIRAHGSSGRHIPIRDLLSYDLDRMHGFDVVRFEVRKQAPLVCALPDPAFAERLQGVLTELKIERRPGVS